MTRPELAEIAKRLSDPNTRQWELRQDVRALLRWMIGHERLLGCVSWQRGPCRN